MFCFAFLRHDSVLHWKEVRLGIFRRPMTSSTNRRAARRNHGHFGRIFVKAVNNEVNQHDNRDNKGCDNRNGAEPTGGVACLDVLSVVGEI